MGALVVVSPWRDAVIEGLDRAANGPYVVSLLQEEIRSLALKDKLQA